jgi:hypothetical protein
MDISFDSLQTRFRHAGAVKLVAKPLAENDNSKQQIYLGGNYEALNILPFEEVVTDTSAKIANFKAKLKLFWLGENNTLEPAPHSQLILYPNYPEVRLSGFLMGCKSAPSKNMQPIPKENRRPKNSWDGRVLWLGITNNREVLAYLSLENSAPSLHFDNLRNNNAIERSGIFYQITLGQIIDTKQSLLDELSRIKNLGWTPSVRMLPNGEVINYNAKNAGGYTLEAHLGVKPNAIAAPDFLGWEIKAYSSGKVTLMTPEPDGGFYSEKGCEAFLRKYGYLREDDSIYFTGIHKVGERKETTGQLMILDGFDPISQKITDVNKGITMLDKTGSPSAAWTYRGLINHWNKKHANAAYIPYERKDADPINYKYNPPALLGIGTDFTKYLVAMHKGLVNYDPAPKLINASRTNSKVKARSQFRISIRNLPSLYDQFEIVEF